MPRGCSYEKNFDIYVVRTLTTGGPKPVHTTTACPEPKVLKSCEPLWQQIADPVIKEMQPVIAAAEAADKTRRQQLTSLNSMHVLNQRIHAMAQSADAEKDLERRKAAAKAAEADAENKRKAAADAERAAADKAERAFKARLAMLNAGQLFVLADELKAEGKTTQAREALRTLIVRFPDHALASNAATTLATL
jgi:TolA-binding protein